MVLSEGARSAIAAELDRARVPDCAIAWTRRDDGASGTLEHGSARADTKFHLFSGTKLYTAAAIMRLVEDGAVRLDAAARTYLPELALRGDLTVRHLASHASGLSDTLEAFLAVHFAGERAKTTAEALARYGLRASAPGRGARYRNVNYALLGEIVSRVSGTPYASYVRSALLEPLGATELSFEDPGGEGYAIGHASRFSPMLLALRVLMPTVAKRLVVGRRGKLVALAPYSLDTAAIGGLVGSAAAFLPMLREMLTQDDGVLRASSKREMLTMCSRGAAGIMSRDGVGIGWKRGTVGGRTFWNHEGGGAGFCSETRLYPDDGLGLVILMNLSQSSSLSKVAHRIAERVRA